MTIETQKFGAFYEDWALVFSEVLEDLLKRKAKEVPSRLYIEGERWKGVLPLKILGETSAIGSALRCWMRGTQSRLE